MRRSTALAFTAPSHFRTTNGQLFSNRRRAAWRLIPPHRKVNIMFRNERPTIMNMSFVSTEGLAMDSQNEIRRSGWRSVVAVALTAVVITFNHAFTLGSGALVLGAALLAVPPALWIWFRRTGNRGALAAYGVTNAWIVVGFGAIKGLWGITLPIFAGTFLSSVSTTYPKPVFGAFGFEISGVAMFLSSLFVLYYGGQLITSRERRVAVSGVAAIGLTAILFAFVALDRDRWTPPAQGIVKIGVIVPTTGPYA